MLNLILDKRNEKDPIIYPYFFLNPERVGITGMITWILALLAGFIVMGYIIMIIDHLLGKNAEIVGVILVSNAQKPHK